MYQKITKVNSWWISEINFKHSVSSYFVETVVFMRHKKLNLGFIFAYVFK